MRRFAHRRQTAENSGPTFGSGVQLLLASDQYLTQADSAAVSMGDVKMRLAIFVKLLSKPANNMAIAGKWSTAGAGSSEYLLYWRQAVDRLSFIVSDGVTVQGVDANDLGAPALDTWYFVDVFHDSDTNFIGITVDDSATFDQAAWTNGIFDSTQALRIGRTADDEWQADIVVDQFTIHKGSFGDQAQLYGNGDGVRYADLNGTNLTDLISYYGFEEASADRRDSHSARVFTAVNSPERVDGIS